jgi:predicted small lipoprotein YifL
MRPRILLNVCAVAFLAAGLAGCGKMGDLERPGPLFGQGKGTAPGADQQSPGQDPSEPVRTIDSRDRNTGPAPSRTDPIPGTVDPARPGPRGVLPDPYANPQ